MIWAALTAFRASKAFTPVLIGLAVLGVFWAGVWWNDRGHTIEKLKTDIETGDRIDETVTPTDPDAVDDGLRGHAGQ